MNEKLIESIHWNNKGLIPCVTQHYLTNEILMVAWVNKESLLLTLKTKYAHYFSRSRQKIWKKGEMSGNFQNVKKLKIDCDLDTLLMLVDQKNGIACHTGAPSCFFNEIII